MARKQHLKVFRAHLGFYDTIVAAPSQKAAIAAWGVGQREFANGFASETKDAKAVAAALARPGVVLRREFGTKRDYKTEPDSLHAPKLSAQSTATLAKARRKRERDARTADNEALALERAEHVRARKLRAIEQREAKLEKERDAAEREYAQQTVKMHKSKRR